MYMSCALSCAFYRIGPTLIICESWRTTWELLNKILNRWLLLQLEQLWLAASAFQRKRVIMSGREMRFLIHNWCLLSIYFIIIVIIIFIFNVEVCILCFWLSFHSSNVQFGYFSFGGSTVICAFEKVLIDWILIYYL